MKKMRRLTSAILILVMSLTMAGCGGRKTDTAIDSRWEAAMMENGKNGLTPISCFPILKAITHGQGWAIPTTGAGHRNTG